MVILRTARQKCEDSGVGARLVEIESAEEENFLGEWLKMKKTNYWLGMEKETQGGRRL